MTTSITNTSITTDTINVDSGVLYVDNTNNRVGVGTASPTEVVEVRDGTVMLASTTTSPSLQIQRNDGSGNVAQAGFNVFGSASNIQPRLAIGVGAAGSAPSAKLFIGENGNVGIGVSNPQRSLVLYESASAQTQIQFQNATTGSAVGDGFGVGLDSAEKGFIWNYEGNDTYIGGAGGTSMTIKNDGNVGIGMSTNLGAKLHVSPSLKVGTYAAGVATGSAVTNSVLCVYSTTNLGTTAGDEVKLLSLSASSGNQSALTFRQRRNADGNNFYTDCFTIAQDVDNSEKTYEYMAFSDNNVGIGTDTPRHNLVVQDDNGPVISLIGHNYNDSMGIVFNGGDQTNPSSNGNTGAKIMSQISINGGQVLGDLTFTTNSGDTFVDAMNIDNSGRVTKPYQPAFNVRLNTSNSTAPSGIDTVTFNQILTNVGSHYSNSTGRFTAPVSGFYQINLSMYYQNGTNYVGSMLQKSDGTIYYNFSSVGPDVFVYTSQAVYLNQNDFLFTRTYCGGSTTLLRQYSYFSGYLIG